MDTIFACLNQPQKTQWMNEDRTESDVSVKDPVAWFSQKIVEQLQNDPAYNWIHNHPSYDPDHLKDFIAESPMAPFDANSKALAITDAYSEWLLKTNRVEDADEAIKYIEKARRELKQELSSGWLDLTLNKHATSSSDQSVMSAAQLPPPPTAETFTAEDIPLQKPPLPKLRPISTENDSLSLNEAESSSDSEESGDEDE